MRQTEAARVLSEYRALGLSLLGGGDDEDFGFDLFFSSGDADQVAVSEALDHAVQVSSDTAPGQMYWDPSTQAWTSSSSSPAALNDLREAAGRIAADPVLRTLEVDDNGDIVFQDGSKVTDPSILSRVGEMLGQGVKFLGNSPNLTRALATLGIGTAGMLLGRAAAGGGSTLTLPSSQAGQNPAVAAAQPSLTGALASGGTEALQDMVRANLQGQAGVAAAAGEEVARARAAAAATEAGSAPIRSLALQNLPGYLQGTAPHPSAGYDQTTGAVMDQLEMILGLAPGSLARPSADQATGGPATPYTKIAPERYRDIATGEVFNLSQAQAKWGADQVAAWDNPPATPTPSPTTRRTLAGVTTDPNLPAMEQKLGELVANGPGAPLADPIADQMAARIQRALEGGELDPATERRIREELEVLKNNLKRAYGAPGQEWESTVGQNLYTKGLESAEALRYGVNKDVVNSLGPQEMQRRTFAITNPQQQYLAELGFYGPQTAQRGQLPAAERRALLATYLPQVQQNAAFNETSRLGNVAQNMAISNLNQPSLASGSTALNSQWGALSPLLGINEPNTFPTLANASLAAFQADQNARAAQAKSVADIFGNAAAALRPASLLVPTNAGSVLDLDGVPGWSSLSA